MTTPQETAAKIERALNRVNVRLSPDALHIITGKLAEALATAHIEGQRQAIMLFSAHNGEIKSKINLGGENP